MRETLEGLQKSPKTSHMIADIRISGVSLGSVSMRVQADIAVDERYRVPLGLLATLA